MTRYYQNQPYQQKTEASVQFLADQELMESRWHQPYSEPVRFKVSPRLRISLITSGLIAPVLDFETQIFQAVESRWHQPWSEPIYISLKHGLRVQFQQFYTASVRYLPTPDVTLTMSANEPPTTDVAEMGVFAGQEPPPIDRTDVDVSVAEIQDQRGGNASIGGGDNI